MNEIQSRRTMASALALSLLFAFAANTAKQVINYENKYYCADEGVWYESESATGPGTAGASA